MHDLTEEELALLAAEDGAAQGKPAKRGRKPAKRTDAADHRPAEHPVDQPADEPAKDQLSERADEQSREPAREQDDDKPEEQAEQAPAPSPAAVRGPHTPAQYEGDGWGDTPVQMRG